MSNGNGNGTDLYDSAPISKWIRPCVAIAGALEGFALLVYDAIYAIASPEPSLAIIAIVGAIAGVGLGYAGWYFGIRSQDKGISTLKSTITELANVVKTQNGTPPKADDGQSAGEGDLPVEPEPVEPEPVEPSQYEPFDEAAFDLYIEGLVTEYAGVQRARQKAEKAWIHGVHIYDWKDPAWIAYLSILFNRWFALIWGLYNPDGNVMESGALEYAEEHLNDDLGCTTCKGTPGCTYPDIEFKANEFGEGYITSLMGMWNLQAYIEGKFLEWQENYDNPYLFERK
jgi:hypothetical protein